MLRTRYSLHVPLTLNDGTPTTDNQLAAIEGELLDIAGGFTATDSTGAWVDDGGTVYRDSIRVYALDIPTPPDELERIATRITHAAELVLVGLDQDAVYLTAQNLSVHLVTLAPIPDSL